MICSAARAMDTAGDKLFPIQSAPERDFYAGHLPGGRQALIARSVYPKIVVAVFDSGGSLFDVVRRDLPCPQVDGKPLLREVDEDEFHEYLKREFGFTPGLVRIKAFCIPEEGFA